MNYLYLGLLFLSLTTVELLAGGANLLFNLPSCAILALISVLTLASFRRSQVPANVLCLAGSAVFFGYVLARILTSPVEYLTRHDLFSVLGALIVYLLLAFHLTSPKHRLWLILGLLVLGLLNVVVGAIQYFGHEDFTLFSFIASSDYGTRATGLYGCPDHLAGFLEVVGLMGLSVACWSRWKAGLKVFVAYAALMCLTGVLLTGSRGGFLSAAFGFLVFVGLSLFTLRKGLMVHKWIVLGVTVLGVVIVVAGVAYFMSSQVNLWLRWSNLDQKSESRFDLWAPAVKQFKLNPVVGTGSGTYYYFQRHFRKSSEWRDAIYAHNDYLQLLAEFGLIGLAGCLFFLGTHVGHGLKSFRWIVNERLNSLGRIRSDTLALNIGALSALATFGVHSAIDFNLHIPANALLLAIVFALLANPGVETPFPSGHYERTNRYARLALPALGLWLALKGLPTLPAEYFYREARVALSTERYRDAIGPAVKGISYDKTNPDLYWSLGDALFGTAQTASTPGSAEVSLNGAVQAYGKGLALFRQERYLLLGMGWSLDALKRFDEAEPYFKEILAAETNSGQIAAYYGDHLRAAGKLDEAEAEYKRSMKLIWNWDAFHGLEQIAKDRAAAAAPKQP